MREIFDVGISITNENANTNNASASGQMMQVAINSSKKYALDNLISKKFGDLHKSGMIHIHDLDYYPTKTSTCLQYDLNELYKDGFYTANGKINEPNSIETYATLATIVFQTNQNEQHGGQSIPAFDFFMAKGVLKSFIKNFKEVYTNFCILSHESIDEGIIAYVDNIIHIDDKPWFDENYLTECYDLALKKTIKDTHQAMQGFIYNLNSMHSRGGNQVVFSSINYGTDTTYEGRLVVKKILEVTREGLGNNEICVFPIQIFKVKKGINYTKDCINYDLFLDAIKTNSTNLYPNFLFLDATFNRNSNWQIDDEKRYMHEVATMGCRTRVFENINGSKTSIGRGNLSFTSLNIVRIAIMSKNNIQNYYDLIYKYACIICDQLKQRYDYQITALYKQFNFMLKNKLWKYNKKYNENDFVGDILNSGTLAIGFIGGHNAMMALLNESHSDSEKANEVLLETVKILNKVCNEYKEKYNLNYSVIATPAEGLSGRFVALDREKYGIIKNVTDKDYYVNSFHVDVKSKVSIKEKIEIESKFHKHTLGGHITYVELDGNVVNNPQAIMSIVKLMYDNDIGYGSINHPLDYCENCGYKGYIEEVCPKCLKGNIVKVRRITGYLTPNIKHWNNAKKAELNDRTKHRS